MGVFDSRTAHSQDSKCLLLPSRARARNFSGYRPASRFDFERVLKPRLVSREFSHVVVAAVGSGLRRSSFTSGGLDLGLEVGDRALEFFRRHLFCALAIPLGVGRAPLSRARLGTLLTGGVMKIT